MIPKILFRTVPAERNEQVEEWWDRFGDLHPTWTRITYRDPIDRTSFPLSQRSWSRCSSGAQRAGFIRLEAMLNHGGVYVDSDVEPFKAFDPLLDNEMFVAWEDAETIPDAIFGAEAGHYLVRRMLNDALNRVQTRNSDWRRGNGAWSTGPGVFTQNLEGLTDGITIYGPELFYRIHWREKHLLDTPPEPSEFARHHWAASWLPPDKRP